MESTNLIEHICLKRHNSEEKKKGGAQAYISQLNLYKHLLNILQWALGPFHQQKSYLARGSFHEKLYESLRITRILIHFLGIPIYVSIYTYTYILGIPKKSRRKSHVYDFKFLHT